MSNLDFLQDDPDLILILQSARALLNDKEKWCMHARARDAEDLPVHPGDTTAVKWCVEGAVGICTSPGGYTPVAALELLDRAAIEIYAESLRIQHVHFDKHTPEEPIWDYVAFESVSYVNDNLGHEAVLKVLDRAIELASER